MGWQVIEMFNVDVGTEQWYDTSDLDIPSY
jgi:hypothetical protein